MKIIIILLFIAMVIVSASAVEITVKDRYVNVSGSNVYLFINDINDDQYYMMFSSLFVRDSMKECMDYATLLKPNHTFNVQLEDRRIVEVS